MATRSQRGSPRFQVRLDATSEADLILVRAWLRERLPDASDSDAIRAALRHMAECVQRQRKKGKQ